MHILVILSFKLYVSSSTGPRRTHHGVPNTATSHAQLVVASTHQQLIDRHQKDGAARRIPQSITDKMTGGDSSGGSHRRLPSLNTSVSQHGALAPWPAPQVHAYPLLLTVRFSTSIPDLLLDVPHPSRTTIAALKHLIRSRLEQPTSQRRLRFIHSGKILADNAIVGTVLKPLPPPPKDDQADVKGKGKAVEGRDAQRVYVICSIGDLLTDAELENEKRKAEEPVPDEALTAPTSPLPPGSRPSGAGGEHHDRGPRGFDRLLAAGFTAAEVNQLRLQFRSIQEARHTADTLPSPDTLRSMEDAWMDNNNAGVSAAAGGPSTEDGGALDGAAGGLGDEFGLAGVLDLLLKGMFIGFVWPLGAIGWLVRDEEKIPKRMRVFVYFGFVLSLLIGTIRVIG